MTPINRNNGFLTLYGLACGYLNCAALHDDMEYVTMGAEGAVYFVKVRGNDPAWVTFERDAAGYREAMRAFRQFIIRERAWIKPCYRESNPKIDLYNSDGLYIVSTNWHATARNALNYYRDTKPQMSVTFAKISKP